MSLEALRRKVILPQSAKRVIAPFVASSLMLFTTNSNLNAADAPQDTSTNRTARGLFGSAKDQQLLKEINEAIGVKLAKEAVQIQKEKTEAQKEKTEAQKEKTEAQKEKTEAQKEKTVIVDRNIARLKLQNPNTTNLDILRALEAKTPKTGLDLAIISRLQTLK